MQITRKREQNECSISLAKRQVLRPFLIAADSSPWTGVELRDGQAVQNAVDLTARLSYETLPSLIECMNRVCESSGLRLPSVVRHADCRL